MIVEQNNFQTWNSDLLEQHDPWKNIYLYMFASKPYIYKHHVYKISLIKIKFSFSFFKNCVCDLFRCKTVRELIKMF
jgi:hypothetical protein